MHIAFRDKEDVIDAPGRACSSPKIVKTLEFEEWEYKQCNDEESQSSIASVSCKELDQYMG